MAFLLKILIARCVLGCEPNGARSIRGGYPSLLDVLSHRTIRNEIAGWIEIRERGFFSHSSMESLITSRHSPSKRLCFYTGNDRNISGISLELAVANKEETLLLLTTRGRNYEKPVTFQSNVQSNDRKRRENLGNVDHSVAKRNRMLYTQRTISLGKFQSFMRTVLDFRDAHDQLLIILVVV